MLSGLCGNHRLLNSRQNLLCLGQRQPQIGDVAITSTRRARLSVPISTNCKTHPIHDPSRL